MVERLDRYQIVEQIIGPEEVETIAWDSLVGRHVRIKEPHPHLLLDRDFFECFLREGRILAKIRSSAVVSLYEILQCSKGEARCCFVLEHIERSLHDVNCDDADKPLIATQIARDALRGLRAIHEAGLLHANIRPKNVMITSDGTAKLANIRLNWSRTRAGTLVQREGKYLPLECWELNAETGPWSDLYSLGCVLYEFLIGSNRFSEVMGVQLIGGGQSPRRLGARYRAWHSETELHVPDVREFNPDVSEELAQTIGRMMKKPIGERFRAAADALAVLDSGSTKTLSKTDSATVHEGKESAEQNTAAAENTDAEMVVAQRSNPNRTDIHMPSILRELYPKQPSRVRDSLVLLIVMLAGIGMLLFTLADI